MFLHFRLPYSIFFWGRRAILGGLSPKNALIWFDVFVFQVSGLGKLSPNSVMVGFKQDWKEDPVKDNHRIVFISAKTFRLAFPTICK